ncbi:MAG: hypothetical protein RLZZ387_1715 [Chloroflexota bacterium]
MHVAFGGDSAIPSVRVGARPKQRGWQGDRALHFGVALFDGLLTVTDAAAFVKTLETGIGSGKAFGFGLLSVGQLSPRAWG